MNWKAKTISTLSIFFLASCATSGDFCAVYQPVPAISEETAALLVRTDRTSAVSIAANEVTYAGCAI